MQLQNFIGFGAADFIELALAAVLVLLAILWPRSVVPVVALAVLGVIGYFYGRLPPPNTQTFIEKQLARIPGKLVVVVRDQGGRRPDSDRIIFVRGQSDAAIEELKRQYPDRRFLLLEPEAIPPRLSDYKPAPPPNLEPPPQKDIVPGLRLEQVR